MRNRRQFDAEEKLRRIALVDSWLVDGASISRACGLAGIHRSQYYRWKQQAELVRQGDTTALEPRSRAPLHRPQLTPERVRNEVIRRAYTGEYRSANAIARALRHAGSRIHTATVIRVLEKAGLYGIIAVTDETGALRTRKRGLKV